MIRRPPRSTLDRSSAASDVYKRQAADRVFMAFSFGPFVGFWAATEGARQLGALMVPGGGRDSPQRLELMREVGATVLLSLIHISEPTRPY